MKTPRLSHLGRFFALLLCAFLVYSFQAKDTETQPQTPSEGKYGIVLHGGAGTILKKNMTEEKEKEYREMIAEVLYHGRAMLEKGATAIQVVESCIQIMEDSPLFNSGKGAVFTNAGKNELDASIMDGQSLKAGAVAGVTTVRHPISAARKVMEESVHVMLSGEGAEVFAKEQGCEIVDPSYFHTDRRWESLQRAKKRMNKDRGSGKGGFLEPGEENDWKYGTVGVAVLDKAGNLAAGTSTGGMTNKRWGRIGDSPVIGAGTYANNATCAVSCTGHGEYFIRYAVAHDISAAMEYKGISVQEAADWVIQEKLVKAGGTGGVIGLDAAGNVMMSFNTAGMYRGFFMNGQDSPWTGIYKDDKPNR
ncbi:MAG: isoaspartyl peptidase/L-asparaginase [Bacteroidota bacterium]